MPELKYTDLRIGNFIKKKSRDKIERVSGIAENYLWLVGYRMLDDHDINDYEGVPIQKNWLVGLGFTKNERFNDLPWILGVNNLIDFRVGLKPKAECSILVEDPNEENPNYGTWIDLPHVQYVHQIQNFFAGFGCDITIDPRTF